MPTVASRYSASSLAVIRDNSLPATRIEPLVGLSRPPIRLSRVDFPDPDYASKATRWPLWTASEIPRWASTGADGEPKTLARPSTSTASLASGNGLAGEAVGIRISTGSPEWARPTADSQASWPANHGPGWPRGWSPRTPDAGERPERSAPRRGPQAGPRPTMTER